MTREEPCKPERRRSEWVDTTCTGCGAPVSRRKSEVQPHGVWCSAGCYNRTGRTKVGRMGGRPQTAETVLVRCPDGQDRTSALVAGYRHLYWPDHPNANAAKRVYEHVVVMADMIGRPLEPHERVHHRNGDRADNRPGNLDLWSTAQPCGQRVEDKVAFAIEMLDLYAPHLLVKRQSVTVAA